VKCKQQHLLLLEIVVQCVIVYLYIIIKWVDNFKDEAHAHTHIHTQKEKKEKERKKKTETSSVYDCTVEDVELRYSHILFCCEEH